MMTERDIRYLNTLLSRIEVCKVYQPRFGRGAKEVGLSLTAFQSLYGSDAFYTWFGLDNPLIYAAHKAAGGITSVYRQIGIGSESLVRQILQDELQLTTQQVNWSYEYGTTSGRKPTLSLDARIHLEDIQLPQQKERIAIWLASAAKLLDINPAIASALRGCVIEVRQGYKSRDAKRQNADIQNAATAYSQGYPPVAMILSNQIDGIVAERYTRNKWLVLRGTRTGDATFSTYAFMRDVIGYDMGAFLEQYAPKLREKVIEVLKILLDPTPDE